MYGSIAKAPFDAATDTDRIRSTMAVLQPGEKAYADANQGWSINEAVRVVRAVGDLDVMIEQPCPTYEECLHVRGYTDLPFKLAASTPPEFLYNTTDLHNYNVEHTGMSGPETRDGKLFASDLPGLDVEPDYESLGDPVAVYTV